MYGYGQKSNVLDKKSKFSQFKRIKRFVLTKPTILVRILIYYINKILLL